MDSSERIAAGKCAASATDLAELFSTVFFALPSWVRGPGDLGAGEQPLAIQSLPTS